MAVGFAAALSACATLPPAPRATADPAPRPPAPETTAFQRGLDRMGIAWRPPARGKAILVNIPAFELIAFQDGSPAFRSRVIVGAPDNQTPRLQTHVSAVRFRPTWRPTPAMIASGEYRDRVWPPGRRNPLGLAAVRLEPGLLVYLHDTNRRDLFERPFRALSHGCIRVQKWDELVAWVLGMERDEVHSRTARGRNVDVAAPPIPVTLGYFLRFPADDGTPQSFEDVYRLGGDVAPASDPAGPGCGPLAASG